MKRTITEEQLAYENLMGILYSCTRGEKPGVEADYWMRLQSKHECFTLDSDNNVARREFDQYLKKIVQFLIDAIDYRIKAKIPHAESKEMNKLLEYRYQLNDNINMDQLRKIMLKMREQLRK